MSYEILTVDGQEFRTGLLLPQDLTTAFAPYVTAGPMLSMDEIIEAVKTRPKVGRKQFGRKWIKNQRSYGSCQGFASALAVSRSRVRRGLDPVFLSGAYAYSLVNGGVDRGSTLENGMRACQLGYATEETVPWDKVFRGRYDTKKADEEAKRFMAFEVYSATSELELFSGLVNDFTAVVAVHAGRNFTSLSREGVAGWDSGPGNHAVGCDGAFLVGSKTLAADHFGSWSESVHDGGYAGLTWQDHFSRTTKNHLFYLIRSTLDDPEADNPPSAKE